MASMKVEMAQRGQVTIPKSLRDEYKWDTGQQFTMIDLGDGVIVMTAKKSTVNSAANRLRDRLISKGATLEDMLADLRRHREMDQA